MALLQIQTLTSCAASQPDNRDERCTPNTRVTKKIPYNMAVSSFCFRHSLFHMIDCTPHLFFTLRIGTLNADRRPRSNRHTVPVRNELKHRVTVPGTRATEGRYSYRYRTGITV